MKSYYDLSCITLYSHISYLENVADDEVCGLLLHEDPSLIVGIDKGERTTEPGVMVGSSSIDFNWLPLKRINKMHVFT